MEAHGDVAFNDALTDVQSMADGAYLKIRDWSAIVPHTVEIRSTGGQISHAYFVGGLSRPWNDEAQRFLATEISRLVRQSGLGASARTKAILEKNGVAGVLDEIDRLEGDYARRVYFQALIAQHHFDAASVLPVLEKVNARMTSDFDRRQILTAIARAVTLDAPAAAAYMRIVESMRSDFDRRQALSAVLAAKPLPPGVADLALKTTADMKSDFDRRQVLHTALANGASVEHVGALLPALASMRSSFDKREVLLDLIRTGSLGADAKPGVLNAVDGVGSDFDKRMVLTAFVRQYGIEASTRDVYFGAVKTMRSDHDKAECLLLLARSAASDPSMRSGVRRTGAEPEVHLRSESRPRRARSIGADGEIVTCDGRPLCLRDTEAADVYAAPQPSPRSALVTVGTAMRTSTTAMTARKICEVMPVARCTASWTASACSASMAPIANARPPGRRTRTNAALSDRSRPNSISPSSAQSSRRAPRIRSSAAHPAE